MRLTCKTAVGYCDMSVATRENKLEKLGQYEDIDEYPEELAKIKKVLEIIKEKDVSPIDIRCCETVEQYNVKENGFIRLTKEEFNLLKEVLL